jgi:hypothetical protein
MQTLSKLLRERLVYHTMSLHRALHARVSHISAGFLESSCIFLYLPLESFRHHEHRKICVARQRQPVT